MAVDMYDVAVTNKIKDLFYNTVYQDRDFVKHTVTDKSSVVKFPLISVFRPDGWSVSSTQNTWKASVAYLNDLRTVYVDMNYQIDLYANTREQLEEITAELVLYLLKNPVVSVKYLSADESEYITVTSTLRYVSGPERTSEMDDTAGGRVYRYTLVFALNNAVLVNFATEGSSDYVTKVTEVDVKVVDVDLGLSESDGSTKIGYQDKEVIYGKN